MGGLVSRIEDYNIDVICQHCRDGRIIPIKIRLTDEDSQIQEFLVKRFKETTYFGEHMLPNGVKVTSLAGSLRSFVCVIEILKRERNVEVLYDKEQSVWRLVS